MLIIYHLLPFSFLFSDSHNSLTLNQQLQINLIYSSNGKGLDTDGNILKKALEEMGCVVQTVSFTEKKWHHAHINIFFQALIPEKFPWARQNWLIPNPEWYEQNIQLLDHLDLILCRTREAERIFKALNKPTYYLGFTSPDCDQPHIQKNYSHLFHLAGGSHLKGTSAIQNIWISYPFLPLLTVINFFTHFSSQQSNLEWINYRVPESDLRQIQNQCGIHLCPSETEGFGHYIMEAMSARAVVITTDAPPMNEFIHDPRCLVPYQATTPLHLATQYYVDPVQLQDKIQLLLSLPIEELQKIGLNNRSAYLRRTKEFHEKLEELMWITSFAFEK